MQPPMRARPARAPARARPAEPGALRASADSGGGGGVKVLITGAFGFIGSHLTDELALMGHDPIPVDIEDGDLRIPGKAMELLVEHKPELVVHLAAKVGRV